MRKLHKNIHYICDKKVPWVSKFLLHPRLTFIWSHLLYYYYFTTLQLPNSWKWVHKSSNPQSYWQDIKLLIPKFQRGGYYRDLLAWDVDLEVILGWHAFATYVLCWGVLEMHFKLTYVTRIPMVWTLNQRMMVPWMYMMMHMSLHIFSMQQINNENCAKFVHS